MTKLYMGVFAALTLAFVSNHSTAFQQASTAPVAQPAAPTTWGQAGPSGGPRPVRSFMERRQNPLKKATEKLKAATDDKTREEARREIRTELEKQYDQFLVNNEKQITDLQARLDKLRDQLERRRSAKSKMVELEMERVLNESEGLIWPNRSGVSGRLSTFGGPARFPGAVAPLPTLASPPSVRSPRTSDGGTR